MDVYTWDTGISELNWDILVLVMPDRFGDIIIVVVIIPLGNYDF